DLDIRGRTAGSSLFRYARRLGMTWVGMARTYQHAFFLNFFAEESATPGGKAGSSLFRYARRLGMTWCGDGAHLPACFFIPNSFTEGICYSRGKSRFLVVSLCSTPRNDMGWGWRAPTR